jgi:hypothetical protein
LFTVHIVQLHDRAASVDKSQRGIGGDIKDRPEGFSIQLTRPADFSAFQLANIIRTGRYDRVVVFSNPGIDQLGEFRPGRTFVRVGE